MSIVRFLGLTAVLLASVCAWADVRGCACDPARPETMQGRECSLCREAESQPPGTEIFHLKDVNPRKPNRWLVLPAAHAPGGHNIESYPRSLQTRIWMTAIAKAKELWGDEWGLAYNGEINRTQCHAHIHIGKLLRGLAPGKWVDVDSPEDIRVPGDGTGVWVHPVGDKLRVHYGEGITETALLR